MVSLYKLGDGTMREVISEQWCCPRAGKLSDQAAERYETPLDVRARAIKCREKIPRSVISTAECSGVCDEFEFYERMRHDFCHGFLAWPVNLSV
tara:strand:+ start:743 stop:1024 length:282 start_codon:yes stop_codon:yes gene_type:complete